jgi:hypothetical protein
MSTPEELLFIILWFTSEVLVSWNVWACLSSLKDNSEFYFVDLLLCRSLDGRILLAEVVASDF